MQTAPSFDHLADGDLRGVLDAVYLIGAHSFEGHVPDQVLGGIADAVRCASIAYLLVDLAAARVVAHRSLPGRRDPAAGPAADAPPVRASYRAAGSTATLLGDLLATLSTGAARRSPRRLPSRTGQERWYNVIEATPAQATLLLTERTTGYSKRDCAVLEVLAEYLREAVRRPRPGRGAAPGPAPDPSRPALTARESQIVAKMSTGATDRAIARALAISERTVHKHLEHIYRKLGVQNRVAVLHAVGASTAMRADP